MDAKLRTAIVDDPDHHIEDAARALCENRCAYAFQELDEQAILLAINNRGLLCKLVKEVLRFLDGDDGNLRVGAAELLGSITPHTQKEEVIRQLERHLEDEVVRDYTYSGAQGDEDDIRTVAECARQSIERLRTAG